MEKVRVAGYVSHVWTQRNHTQTTPVTQWIPTILFAAPRAAATGALRGQRTASSRTTTDFEVGVPLSSATESSGTSTFVSG
jgi:hypothetical protein